MAINTVKSRLMYQPPYGDLTEINTCRLVLKSVGKDALTDIISDYLDILGTSAAVYEKNGDYALGIFSSGWCQFLDMTSRKLCGTCENKEALESGRWLCHESCWTKASKVAIETKQPVDIECLGGIRIFAVPILVEGEAVGSMNFGYGTPPKDRQKLREIAEKFGTSVDELLIQAKAYKSRPYTTIEICKKQLLSAARLVALAIEHKRAVEALRESEERYRTIFENTGMATAIIDEDTTFSLVNSEFEKLLGYSKEETEGKKSWTEFVLKEDLDRLRGYWKYHRLRRIDPNAAPRHYETRIVDREGKIKNVLVTIDIIPGTKRHVVSLLDITESKRVEEALRQSESRYRTLFYSAPVGIGVATYDGTILAANEAMFQMTGYSQEEIGQINLADTYQNAEERGLLLKYLQTEGLVSNFEVGLKRKDGSPYYASLTITPFTLGDKEVLLTVEENISESKRLEGELKQYQAHLEELVKKRTAELTVTNERLERELASRKKAEEETEKLLKTIETAREAINITSSDGTIVYTNSAMDELFGYRRGELIGKSWAVLNTGPKPDAITKKVINAIQKEGYWEGEIHNKRKDGTQFISSARITALRDEDGRIINFISTQHDITKRKWMEERLQELYTVERRLRQELEEQIKQRIEFTRALVHELKTPLTPLLGASEALANQPLEGAYPKLAKNIYVGACQLNRRIDELFDLAKGEIGMLKINCKPVDPLRLIHEVAEQMAPDSAKKGKSLTLELPSSLPPVWVDEDRLKQIMLNLLNNAFKFTPEGGRVTVKAIRKNSKLIIEVQDTGPGIAKEDQQRLFQPYHRLESDREGLSGLGLGLALAKTLVVLHQGEIWVKSQRGEGSTFGFSIPVTGAGSTEIDMKNGSAQ